MKVNPAALIEREGCKSYEDLVKVLQERGVVPPPKDKVSSFFAVPEPPKPQKKPVAKDAPPPKKKVSRRPRPTKQKLGVAAKNNAGSKDAPKSDS